MYGPYHKCLPQFEYRNAMGTFIPINYGPSNLTNADQGVPLSMARTSTIRTIKKYH
ncbi:hypothetical protein SS50377_25823 [Spironucleus salmonicida]|uniref:Uncharacterized protein n=1 Tax=Spironucleus salmonicida TaxID=348837 RepID=V6LMH6_9EUKA|nr:hypothetical protein SS50377_25823 [Spironucleus salmonicida]|eukprot:EST45418.1 Hypothetical protein SS50377_14650 [Spironucleus salmonicida]